jgi:hypothetical protein
MLRAPGSLPFGFDRSQQHVPISTHFAQRSAVLLTEGTLVPGIDISQRSLFGKDLLDA